MALFLFVIIIAIVLGILGIVLKGLFYLLIIAIVIFLINLIIGSIRYGSAAAPSAPASGQPAAASRSRWWASHQRRARARFSPRSVRFTALGEHGRDQIPQRSHQTAFRDLDGVLTVTDLIDRPPRIRAVGRREIQIGPAEQFTPAGGVRALLRLHPGTPDAAVPEDARHLDVHRTSLSQFPSPGTTSFVSRRTAAEVRNPGNRACGRHGCAENCRASHAGVDLHHPGSGRRAASRQEGGGRGTGGPAPRRAGVLRADDVEQAVRINGAVQLVAGSMLALGRFPRVSALAVAASLLPTTYAGHRFWETDDKQERTQQRIHFLKNVSMFGGLLIAAGDTAGNPSIAWRGLHALTSAKRDAALATKSAKAGAKAGAKSRAKSAAKVSGKAAPRRAGWPNACPSADPSLRSSLRRRFSAACTESRRRSWEGAERRAPIRGRRSGGADHGRAPSMGAPSMGAPIGWGADHGRTPSMGRRVIGGRRSEGADHGRAPSGGRRAWEGADHGAPIIGRRA